MRGGGEERKAEEHITILGQQSWKQRREAGEDGLIVLGERWRGKGETEECMIGFGRAVK